MPLEHKYKKSLPQAFDSMIDTTILIDPKYRMADYDTLKWSFTTVVPIER